MNIDPDYFEAILIELIEENALACQGILSISEVVFTGAVPTLSVTLRDNPPKLLVNLGFIREHCTKEVHVKTILLHEFLHVLLNHTGEYEVSDRAINLALDAVINHIIHRSCGAEYSEFFRRYYRKAEGWQCLLVPPAADGDLRNNHYDRGTDAPLQSLRAGLWNGTVLADDILDLARGLPDRALFLPSERVFIGNHDPEHQSRKGGPQHELIVEALKQTFRQFNGEGIFRVPRDRGCAAPPVDQGWAASEEKLRRWERTAWKVLQPLLMPDPKSRRFDYEDRRATLPVLNGSDRRGFLRSLWSPLIPEIAWDLPERRQARSTVVYLDVSGSMHAEMQSLVTLLNRLRRWVRLPFWAFSDEVVPATIEKGVLKTSTTGGTAMNCVLEHLAQTRPEKALVVTDGYIERCDRGLLAACRETTIHALVSRDGSTRELEKVGIACTQLSPHPDGTPRHT
jgi:hypothetical protein